MMSYDRDLSVYMNFGVVSLFISLYVNLGK